MKNFIAAFLCVMLFQACSTKIISAQNDIISHSEFKNPSNEYRPWVYWYWMNGNVSKEGALADIEAMHKVGIGGVFLMDIGIHPQGKVKYRSEEWWDIVTAVAKKCDEYDMKITFNCPGWATAGGPWITPERGMQEVTWSEVLVDAGKSVKIKLPLPKHQLETYSDIAVLAFPTESGSPKNILASAILFDEKGKAIKKDWKRVTDQKNIKNVRLPDVFEARLSKPVKARSLFVKMDQKYIPIDLKLSVWNAKTKQWQLIDKFRSLNAAFGAQHSGAGFPEVESDRFKFEFSGGPDNYLKSFTHINLTNQYRMKNWPNRSGFSVETEVKYIKDDLIENKDIINFSDIIDVTKFVGKDGNLKWKAPKLPNNNNWTILRVGYTPTGRETNPSLFGIEKLEAGKLSKESAELHYKGMWEPVFERFGKDLTHSVVMGNHIDSYEAAWQNWTAKFPEKFTEKNNYDIIKYLPALTGRVVEDQLFTEGFMWDFKRTISDLYSEEFLTSLVDLAHNDGFKQSNEGYGGPFEYLQAGTKVDFPMVEYWWPNPSKNKYYSSPIFSGRINLAERIGYEAFTSEDNFKAHPYSLKQQGDMIFASGVNWNVIHVYTQQPSTDPHLLPGFTCNLNGVHFDRGNTWFFKSKPYLDYTSRCQYMLRLGKPVTDILQYGGTVCAKNVQPVSVPFGYEFDMVSERQLHEIKVVDGNIVFPSGKEYKVFYYNCSGYESLASLKEIDRIAKAGATIVIKAGPKSNPSLKDRKTSQKDFDSLQQFYNKSSKSVAENGKGTLYYNYDIAEALPKIGLAKDYEKVEGDVMLQITHRETSDKDIYFVANQDKKATWVSCKFRVSGMVPKIFNPMTGEVEACPIYVEKDSMTKVTLFLDDTESRFIVFEKSHAAHDKSIVSVDKVEAGAGNTLTEYILKDNNLYIKKAGNYTINFSDGSSQKIESAPVKKQAITGAWNVNFPAGWGAPENVTFPKLIAWDKHENEGVRHFSGTATYKKSFNVSSKMIGKENRLYLDLGQVDIIADVKLNGKKVAILWKPPFIADITDFVKEGENKLEIEVVNQWANRLIGDEKYSDDATRRGNWYQGGIPNYADWLGNNKPRPEKGRLTFTTWKYFRKNDELWPSGLVGPVNLKSIKPVRIDY